MATLGTAHEAAIEVGVACRERGGRLFLGPFLEPEAPSRPRTWTAATRVCIWHDPMRLLRLLRLLRLRAAAAARSDLEAIPFRDQVDRAGEDGLCGG